MLGAAERHSVHLFMLWAIAVWFNAYAMQPIWPTYMRRHVPLPSALPDNVRGNNRP